MCKDELLRGLKEIIRFHVEDKELADELIRYVESSKIKYVVHELDRLKISDFNLEEKELLKDIYFNFC